MRLEVPVIETTSAALPVFQFLIGAIGSNEKLCYSKGIGMFQFLIGAIGRGTGIADCTNRNEFQFLIGAIGRPLRRLRIISLRAVSIPYWCDWKIRMRETDL